MTWVFIFQANAKPSHSPIQQFYLWDTSAFVPESALQDALFHETTRSLLFNSKSGNRFLVIALCSPLEQQPSSQDDMLYLQIIIEHNDIGNLSGFNASPLVVDAESLRRRHRCRANRVG